MFINRITLFIIGVILIMALLISNPLLSNIILVSILILLLYYSSLKSEIKNQEKNQP